LDSITGSNENYLLLKDINGRMIKKFGKFSKEFPNLLKRLEGGGIVVDSNNRIYQCEVHSPIIKVYHQRGNYIDSFGIYPEYYKEIE